MEDYFNEKIHELSTQLKDVDIRAASIRADITYYNQQHQAFKLQRETALASFSDTKEAEKHVTEWKAVIRKLEKRKPEAPIVYLRVIYARPGRRSRTIGIIDDTTQRASAVPTDIQKKAITALGMRIDFIGAGTHGYTPREESPRMDPYIDLAPEVIRARGVPPRHAIISGHYQASPRDYRITQYHRAPPQSRTLQPSTHEDRSTHDRRSSSKKKHTSHSKKRSSRSSSKRSKSKSVPTTDSPREHVIVLKD